MVFLQTIKSLKSIFYFDIFWVFVSGNFLSKFCTSNKYYSCFSHTHTAQFRSSQCFGLFCVLQLCFSQLHKAQHICEKNVTPVFAAMAWVSMQNMITSLAWPLRFRHGLSWIWLNPGQNSNQTNWKSKVGHTWPSVSTWGSHPSFQAVWLHKSIGI